MNEFSHPITVTADDVDMLGHTNNVAYLRWVQDVAVAHSDAVGFDFEAYRSIGAVFVVRRHEIEYLRPTFRGDTLVVRTWVPSATAATCLRRTEITRGPDVVCTAQTVWGFVDLTAGRLRRIPKEIVASFESDEQKISRGVSLTA